MSETFGRLLVTGGAGFIGNHFARHVLRDVGGVAVRVFDKLTYAGDPRNLDDLRDAPGFEFVRGDICDADAVADAARDVDAIVNFAAETHVDRSIADPAAFLRTDVFGTHILLEAARRFGHKRYLQVSTDEVYGSIEQGAFTEASPLEPNSPYSASKAGADHLVRAFHVTYGLPALVTRSSNNYGPRQYPEKMMPLFITNALDRQPVPLYGDGLNVRDWLHVRDNCRAIWRVLVDGAPGEVYNIGGAAERTNLDVTRAILAACGRDESLIRPTPDRPGHDRRYAVDTDKVRALGWRPETDFDAGLADTVAWYRDHRDWWEPIKNGEFRDYYRRQYASTDE